MYFEREENRLKLPPELNNCPTECPNLPRYYDANRQTFCDECPHKIERNNLKAAAEELIFQMLDKTDEKYTVENVLTSVYHTRSLKELPREQMTVKTAEMVMIYQSEKIRADDTKEADKN